MNKKASEAGFRSNKTVSVVGFRLEATITDAMSIEEQVATLRARDDGKISVRMPVGAEILHVFESCE